MPSGSSPSREPERGAFTPTEIGLLQTFADQAVIAVENVRLFKELEARNRDLSEALEQQTATAEILRVISSSPTDFGPVLDAIATCAMRVCSATTRSSSFAKAISCGAPRIREPVGLRGRNQT